MESAPTALSSPSDDTVHVVAVQGDIDIATADGVGEAIRNAIDGTPRHTRVVVDCAHVPMIDSRGLGMMLTAQRHADRTACALSWAGLGDHVRKVLAVTALDATVVIESAPAPQHTARQ